MTTGQLIKLTRQDAGLTQKELANRLGLSESYLSQYERDLRRPKLETLQRIAAALGVPVESLLDPAMFSTDSPPAVPLEYVANEMNLPVDIVRDVLQSSDPAAKQKVAYIRSILSSELSSDALLRIQASLYKLNLSGQEKAVERVEELTEIPKYRWDTETPPEAQDGPPEAK